MIFGGLTISGGMTVLGGGAPAVTPTVEYRIFTGWIRGKD